MTTKAPSAVLEFGPETLEKTAYASVADVATVEPNDRNRLGYHVWRWLAEKQGTLSQAVTESGARLEISHSEAVKKISDSLRSRGIIVS